MASSTSPTDLPEEPAPTDAPPSARPTPDARSTGRPYIRVRPSDAPLTTSSIVQAFRRLHQLGRSATGRRWAQRLRRTTTPPTIEWLLVATPASSSAVDETPTISYYVGTDADHDLASLEPILRELFPDTYELEQVTFDLEALPDQIVERTPAEAASESTVAAVEYQGCADRRKDWQTQLTPFGDVQTDEDARVPLAGVLEAMAKAPGPVVYQVLCRPHPDFTISADTRRIDLERGRATLGGRLLDELLQLFLPRAYEEATESGTHTTLPAATRTRIDELAAKDSRQSFGLTARAVVFAAPDDAEAAQATASALANALTGVSHTGYRIEGVVRTDGPGRLRTTRGGTAVFEALCDRQVCPPRYDGVRTRVPFTTNRSRGIVADPTEAPSFCLLGGRALTAAGVRGLATTPGEQTALTLPPPDRLRVYQTPGLTLGHPLTQDDTPTPDPIALPPDLQPLHVAWFGKTGSGKTTSLISAILANHAVTDGADILIDPKGDGMATDYLRAHYATYGSLDDVVYFDCASVLPAFSFFDIRDDLAAGVDRTRAVEDRVDHYVEMLAQIMGQDRFDQAVRSPDIIRYLIKAQFDPVHGDDAFSHRELHGALRRMHERQSAPAVSDPDLERMLGGVVANRARSFDEIMQGVANRIEKIPVDRRLARVFNHVPDRSQHATTDATDDVPADQPSGDPHFDLVDYLDENVVIVFDTGGLRSEAQRVLTLVILSNLWTALRRRSDLARDAERSVDGEAEGDDDGATTTDDPDPSGDHALVNLYLEEAASVAVSDLVKELLAQSRGFGLSMTLAMQFPAQLRDLDETAYDEVLNNVSTFVTGNVPIDRRLAERLATDDMDPQAVGNRLRALRRGQWFVSLPAPFDEREPRPFLVRSGAPPPGDPAGDRPLSVAERTELQEALTAAESRTIANCGLTLESPSTAHHEATSGEDDGPAVEAGTAIRVDTALPHTRRLPPTVEYDDGIHALRCTNCDNRYDPSIDGMRRAIECCGALEDVDRDDVPICALNLKLTPEERYDSEWSLAQLLFLQAVYNAQQLRYDPLEYDILHDSMIRLQEYVGIESDAVQELIDADLLHHDCDHPHRLFSVRPAGREVIGESYREGVDYGHGQGDLDESSQHVFAIEVGRRYLEQAYVDDADSPVVEVIPYYDIDEQRRLDIAGLDRDGEIRVTVEVERINHDAGRAIPDDYDKMADCDPEVAIWIVMNRKAGHQVLSALNDPVDGEPRVEKTYSQNTPPQQFRIDEPGLTAIVPVEALRDRLG